ncbi:MAG: PLP-dependent aminotransferase family protein [Clostridia bacterium]|nr:PLP-dependent aminotransferase family protein [Clostridia bacterium]
MKPSEKKYLRIYGDLRTEIASGARLYGEKLPSRRELAAERGVSVVTVNHSYELLLQEGYIEARPRSGYYVCYRVDEVYAGGRASAPKMAHAAHTDSETAPFPYSVMAKAVRRVLSDHAEEILVKSPNQGLIYLREALGRYLARSRGVYVRPEQIYVGSGAEYLYGLIVESLGNDRVFGIESPSYHMIEQVYTAKGVTCDLLPLGDDGIMPEALLQTGASVLHVTPFRSFPSGVTASASKRAAYLRWADTADRYIVEDDFDAEFSLMRKHEETLFSQSDRGNVIYLNTFSHTVSPAIRMAYMALPDPLTDLFRERIGFYSCPVPALEQYLMTELLDGGDFERHINRVRRALRRRAMPDGVPKG